ncbi:MAG: hypothetical protein ACP5KA_05045 [Desulfurococcaceae archaeon]|jgi:hypothetical protein
MRLISESSVQKLSIEGFFTSRDLVGELCSGEFEYVKVSGYCNEVVLHAYLYVEASARGDCALSLVGVVFEVPHSMEVGNEVLLLFKHSDTIIKEGPRVFFFIRPQYAVGVCYVMCRGSQVTWSSYTPVDRSELEYFYGD